jgi:hypothetical protein
MKIRALARRRQEGSALLVTVMLLVILALIGFASLDTVTRDRQAAGYQSRARTALYAADAGVATAANLISVTLNSTAVLGVAALAGISPPLPVTMLGDAAVHPYGLPSFGPEPGFPAIRHLAMGSACADAFGGMSEEIGSGAEWKNAIWEIRVQGQTADGVPSRVQATFPVCRAFNG